MKPPYDLLMQHSQFLESVIGTVITANSIVIILKVGEIKEQEVICDDLCLTVSLQRCVTNY